MTESALSTLPIKRRAIGIIATLQIVVCMYFVHCVIRQSGPVVVVVALTAVLCVLLLLILSVKGHFHVASRLLVFFLYGLALFTAATQPVSVPQCLLLFSLCLSLSGILLGTKFTIRLYLLTVVVMAMFVVLSLWLRSLGVAESMFTQHVGQIVVFGLIIGLLFIYNQELERALIRAKESELQVRAERDVLDRKVEERTAQLRVEHIARLVDANKFASYGKLSLGVLHDLVNPLTSILLIADGLRTKKFQSGIASSVRSSLTDIINNANKMEDLLKFARDMCLNPGVVGEFDSGTEVEKVCKLYSARAMKLGSRLVCDVQPGVKLLGNSHKFCQVLANLLSNAIEASASVADGNDTDIAEDVGVGGIVARECEPRKILVELRQVGNICKVSVTDWGRGILPENLADIFSLGYSTKKGSTCSGIGLFLVRELVESDFGGTVLVSSSERGPTVFTVNLPPSPQYSSGSGSSS